MNTVKGHMIWEQTTPDGLGELRAEFWGKLSDRADDDLVDFQTAVEITALEFPPQFAMRRKTS
jgi:hypothetical protein